MAHSGDTAAVVVLVVSAACAGLMLLPAVAGTGGEALAATPNATERPIDIETDRVNIYLHAQQTTVEHDESIIFVHSVTNYITNDQELTVQLILEAPQGSDIHGTEGADEGSGSQFTTTTTLEPGEHESMRIHVDLYEPGHHEITGQAVYFFGDDRDDGEGVEVTIPVEQQPEPPSTEERVFDTIVDGIVNAFNSSPSITVFVTVVVLFLISLIVGRVVTRDESTMILITAAVSVVLILGVVIAGLGVLGVSPPSQESVQEPASPQDSASEQLSPGSEDDENDISTSTSEQSFPEEECGVSREQYAEDLGIEPEDLGWEHEGDGLYRIYNTKTGEHLEYSECEVISTTYEDIFPVDCEYKDRVIERLEDSGYDPSELNSEVRANGELRVWSDDGEFDVLYAAECDTSTEQDEGWDDINWKKYCDWTDEQWNAIENFANENNISVTNLEYDLTASEGAFLAEIKYVEDGKVVETITIDHVEGCGA